MEIEYNSFLSETKTAITTNNGAPQFNYLINEDEFIWKKDSTEKLKIIYGKANLEKCETFQNILFNSIDIISYLKSQLADYKKEQVTGIDQINDFKKLLEQATNCKEENEKDVFKKFICLLNSKKEKINELRSSVREERLPSTNISSDDDTFNQTVVEQFAIESSDSSEDDSLSIPILPKRRKFQPIIKVIEKEKIEADSSQKSSADSEDLYKDM